MRTIIIVILVCSLHFFSKTTTVSIYNRGEVLQGDTLVSSQDVAGVRTNDLDSQEPTSKSDVISLIVRFFPDNYETMIAIAKAESSLNPNAVHINNNGSKDVGLLQINSVHGYDEEWLKVPENNLKVALEIYKKQGYNAWVAYKNL